MAFPGMPQIETKSVKSDIFYIADRLALSMSIGNTNQVGQDCWNAFFTTVNRHMRSFVNNMNVEYLQGKSYFL